LFETQCRLTAKEFWSSLILLLPPSPRGEWVGGGEEADLSEKAHLVLNSSYGP